MHRAVAMASENTVHAELARTPLLGTSVNKGKKFHSFGYRQQMCVVALGKEDVPTMEVISRWPR